MSIRMDIMALPANERLPYALDLLDELTGQNVQQAAWLGKAYNLTQQEAKVFLVLNAAAPRVVTKRAIFESVWGLNSEVEIKIVDVVVCKMRSKGVEIITEWGVGYSMANKIEIGKMTAELVNRHRQWTAQDDEDLLLMVKNGSSLRAMAYEMDRTERGVLERIKKLTNA